MTYGSPHGRDRSVAESGTTGQGRDRAEVASQLLLLPVMARPWPGAA